ncbi:MAG: kelch repeat-containing protein [Sphingomonadales bacterium]
MRYLFLFICTLPFFVLGQYNTWTKLNDVGMGKRERATGFAIGSVGYLCGGIDTAEVIHKDLWAYNPQADAWTQKADLPGSPRRDAISFVMDNYAFVGSGMDSVSGPTGNILKDFWRYNPQSNSWSAIADFPGAGGQGIYFATGFSVAGKGYLCGGKTGPNVYSSQLWEYKPSNNQWIQRANFPGGVRYQMISFVVGAKAYVGMGTDQNIYKKDVYCYNPGANSWQPIAPFPAYERAAASTFTLEERGFVCLGNNGGLLSDLIEYNPKTDSWTLRSAYGGSERKGAISFVIDNKAYVGTGKGTSGKKDSWYVYEPSNYAALEELEAQIQIYPNPVESTVHIDGLSKQINELSIYNAMGKLIQRYNFQAYDVESIDLTTLPQGAYILQFRGIDGLEFTKKIMKR